MFRLCCYLLFTVSICSGCSSTNQRVSRPTQTEEFSLPPANDSRVLQDPAYPDDKKGIEAARPAMPASMRAAQGGGPPGMNMNMGNGMGPMR